MSLQKLNLFFEAFNHLLQIESCMLLKLIIFSLKWHKYLLLGMQFLGYIVNTKFQLFYLCLQLVK